MYEDSGEFKKVWLAIIERLLLDAEGRDMTGVKPHRIDRMIREAKEYLLRKDNNELKLICQNAGFNYEKLVKLSRDKYNAAESKKSRKQAA